MKNCNSDLALVARIRLADLDRGCDWRSPAVAPKPVARPQASKLVAGTVLLLTSLLSTAAHAGGLSDAVAAHYGKSAAHVSAHHRSAPKASPKSVKRTPVCSGWVELWQGSGMARECEGGAL